jgi:hypothetical protein
MPHFNEIVLILDNGLHGKVIDGMWRLGLGAQEDICAFFKGAVRHDNPKGVMYHWKRADWAEEAPGAVVMKSILKQIEDHGEEDSYRFVRIGDEPNDFYESGRCGAFEARIEFRRPSLVLKNGYGVISGPEGKGGAAIANGTFRENGGVHDETSAPSSS